jgi:hypothetical protein
MNEDQIRELFREMRDEQIPPDSLVRVRQAVAERQRRGWSGQWSNGGWKIATGVLAMVCLVLVVLLLRPMAAPVRLPVASPVVAAEPEVPIETPVVVVRKAPKKAQKPLKRATPAPAALIRIENPDDPDVVILLVN